MHMVHRLIFFSLFSVSGQRKGFLPAVSPRKGDGRKNSLSFYLYPCRHLVCSLRKYYDHPSVPRNLTLCTFMLFVVWRECEGVPKKHCCTWEWLEWVTLWSTAVLIISLSQRTVSWFRCYSNRNLHFINGWNSHGGLYCIHVQVNL